MELQFDKILVSQKEFDLELSQFGASLKNLEEEVSKSLTKTDGVRIWK